MQSRRMQLQRLPIETLLPLGIGLLFLRSLHPLLSAQWTSVSSTVLKH